MKKTKMKRFIAIVLAVVMCFTMTTTVGFAANVPAGGGDGGGGELDVLVLGNSTSSGFGMPDFVNRSEGFATFNNYLEDWAAAVDGVETWTKEAAEAHNSTPGNAALGRMSNMSYPWLFKSYLVKEKGFSKVKLNPICLNGMRTDELRAYLDKDYYDKVSAREYAYAEQWIKDHQLTGNKADKEKYKGFMNAHIEMYTRDFYRSGAINENSFAAAQEYVQDSIKNADVIVVDLCGNNFGTYIGYRIAALLGMNDPYVSNTYETIKDVDDIPNGLGVKIDKLINDNLGNTDLMKNPLAKQILLKAWMVPKTMKTTKNITN